MLEAGTGQIKWVSAVLSFLILNHSLMRPITRMIQKNWWRSLKSLTWSSVSISRGLIIMC